MYFVLCTLSKTYSVPLLKLHERFMPTNEKQRLIFAYQVIKTGSKWSLIGN